MAARHASSAGKRRRILRPLSVGVLTLFACACAPIASPPSPLDAPAVASVRVAAESRVRAQTQHQWARWVGRQSPRKARNVLRQTSWLHGLEPIQTVRKAKRRADDATDRRALGHLQRYLVLEHLRATTAAAATPFKSLRDLEVALPWGGTVRFARLNVVLAKLASPQRRRALWQEREHTAQGRQAAFQKRAERLRDSIQDLGYLDSQQMLVDAFGWDCKALQQLARQVLRSSQAAYDAALAALAPTLTGRPASRLGPADVPRLLLHSPADAAFTQPAHAARETLAALGLSADELAIRVDDAPHAAKRLQPASFPISAPSDIRISIHPIGGVTDYEALLHELGHGLQMAHTQPSRFELQVLGTPAVSEAFAFLFQDLVLQPQWLQEHVALSEAQRAQHLATMGLRRLLWLRRTAAQLLFVLDGGLDRAPEQAARHYQQWLQRAYGFDMAHSTPARYFIRGEKILSSADYLVGWLLAAQLQRQLQRDAETRSWWRHENSQQKLHDLWRKAQLQGLQPLLRYVETPRVNAKTGLARLATALATPEPGPQGWTRTIPTPPRRSSERVHAQDRGAVEVD